MKGKPASLEMLSKEIIGWLVQTCCSFEEFPGKSHCCRCYNVPMQNYFKSPVTIVYLGEYIDFHRPPPFFFRKGTRNDWSIVLKLINTYKCLFGGISHFSFLHILTCTGMFTAIHSKRLFLPYLREWIFLPGCPKIISSLLYIPRNSGHKRKAIK